MLHSSAGLSFGGHGLLAGALGLGWRFLGRSFRRGSGGFGFDRSFVCLLLSGALWLGGRFFGSNLNSGDRLSRDFGGRLCGGCLFAGPLGLGRGCFGRFSLDDYGLGRWLSRRFAGFVSGGLAVFLAVAIAAATTPAAATAALALLIGFAGRAVFAVLVIAFGGFFAFVGLAVLSAITFFAITATPAATTTTALAAAFAVLTAATAFAAFVFIAIFVYVAAAGDMTPAELGATLDKLMGDLPAKGAPLPPRAELAVPGGVQATEFPGPQTTILFWQQGLRFDDPDYFAATILNEILGGNGYDDVRAVAQTVADGFSFIATVAMRSPAAVPRAKVNRIASQ